MIRRAARRRQDLAYGLFADRGPAAVDQLLAQLQKLGQRNLRLCTELETVTAERDTALRRIEELQLTVQALARQADTAGARRTEPDTAVEYA